MYLVNIAFLSIEPKKFVSFSIDLLESEFQHYTDKGALMDEDSSISKASAIDR
jgi:hypothetical protein